MKVLHIAVAGCGPGGLAAALMLKRCGHHVTLFERFPEPRPVGSGLMIQPTGLSVLDQLGLAEKVKQSGAAIKGLHGLSMPSRRLALHMDYRALGPKVWAFGVHRSLLFDILFDEVCQSGIHLETGKEISGTQELAAEQRRLTFIDGTASPGFDLIIDAMGSRSTLSAQARDLDYGAIWVTLNAVSDQHYLPDRLDQRYHLSRQMAGIMPIGQSKTHSSRSVAYFWSLRRDQYAQWQKSGLAHWRDEATKLWPESAPLIAQIKDIDQFVYATYQHRTLRSPISTGLAHIGDAWHATSPQLGQGANMALLDAAALAWALQSATDLGDALSLYARSRRRHVRIYQALSRIFTPVFQSEGKNLPALRDLIVGPLSRIPLAGRLAAKMVAGEMVRALPKSAFPELGQISSQAGSLDDTLPLPARP